MMHVNFGYAFWHNMATIPKIVKSGPFLAYFLPGLPPLTAIISLGSCSIFGLFMYLKMNFVHQNFGKITYFAPKWPDMAVKLPFNGHKMAIIKLNQSTTCGYSKLVPGDA